MYIETVPNRGSPPAILLRESYREGGKVKKRTLLNLTDFPPDVVEGFRAVLKGGRVAPNGADPIIVRRSLPHGHVAAVLGVLRQSGLDRLLGGAGRIRDLVTAMIVMRLIHPASKLATARMLAPILFEETEHEEAAKARASIVAKAQRSQAAKDKDAAKKTPDGLPVHSLRTLFADLATFARLDVTTAADTNHVFTLYTRPTPPQSRAFELLGINPERTQ